MDLTTPPVAKSNSEAIMALNVQPNYGGGFSRIEGYECFDGITVPSKMTHCYLVVDREFPQDVVGKQFTLAGTQCYILSAEGTRLAIATLGHLDVDAGNVFTLDDQRYQMKSATFLDSGDASIYQSFQAKAFQIGIDLVQPVTGENTLRGVVELNDQVIAFRDQSSECGVFLATKTGWQQAPTTYLVELKEIVKPKDFIDGTVFNVGAQQGELLSCALSADDKNGHVVIGLPVSPDSEIHINGSFAAKVKSCSPVALTKGKQWQFVYHNFYGSPETQYAYGCNGEEVVEIRHNGSIIPIVTNTEKPKYICAHRNHLFVAFDGGQFGHSLVGKPTHWSVLLGSEQFGVGDEITALSSTVGGVLLIGCRYKVAALYGGGRDDWVLKDISKVGIKSGTLQTAFMPIAISQHGIIRVDATEQFGDFKLSETDSSRKLGFKPIENNIIFSSVKSKANQVRFYSENALHICMMLQPNGSTKCSYFLYPDRLKGVWQTHNYTFLAFDDGKVYRQSDDCFSFAGKPIEWLIKMAFNHCGSPMVIKSWKSAELQATAQGTLPLHYRFDLDYNNDFHAATFAKPLSVVGSGGRWNESLWNDFLWSASDYETKTLYLNGHSRNLSLSFTGNDLYAPQFELTGLILNYIPRRSYRV
ncbi:hypothetical protein ACFGYY_06490 [Pasteurella multocida]